MDNAVFARIARLPKGPSQRGVYTPAPTVRIERDAVYHEWESPAALVRWLAERPGQAHNGMRSDESWASGTPCDKSARRAVYGWPEGLAGLREAVTNADRALVVAGQEETTSYQTSGSFVDVAAYLSGQPECMVEFVIEDRPIRRLSIAVDGFISSAVSPSTIAARGKAVVAAAMALQAQGIAVEITYRMRYRVPHAAWQPGREKPQDFAVRLWKSGGATDLGVLAGTLVSVGFLRQLFFEAQVQATGNVSSGIAKPSDNRWREVHATPGVVTVESNLIVKREDGYQERLEWSNPKAIEKFIAKCFAAAV